MNKSISAYKTLVFDCDGVVLNSNKIKTQAFYEATKHFGHDFAQALVDYHVANGGISRYLKFEYFLKHIVQQSMDQNVLDDLLIRFAEAVNQGLMQCEISAGLQQIKNANPNANWLIVSGGDQAELRDVFAARGLDSFFDGGIFGSPDDKDTILARELSDQTIVYPALFIGDSKYDYIAADKAGLDFVFVTDWTEVQDWPVWAEQNNLSTYDNLHSLSKV